MKRLSKLLSAVGVILTLLAVGLAVGLVPIGAYRRRQIRIGWVHRLSRYVLKRLGVSVRVGGGAWQPQQGVLVVSNHLSYLDVLALASLQPFVFVTSTDVQRDGIWGKVSGLGGSVFVDRGSLGVRGDIRKVAQLLKEGFSVAIFPEATSGDGSGLLRFKRALFDAARIAGAPVQPVVLNYKELNGESVTADNRDLLFYYGEMQMASHLLALLRQQSAVIELEPLTRQEITESNHSSEIRDATYRLIAERYQPIGAAQSSSGGA